MALDASILNVGEYFSAHYLSDNKGFTKDIAEHLKKWKDQGSQATPRKLQALGDAYYKAKSKALDYPEPTLRCKAKEREIASWHPQLLSALGYTAEPAQIELLSEQKQLLAQLYLHRNNQPWLAILQAPFCINSGDQVEEALEETVEAIVNTEVETTTQNQQETALPLLQTTWEQAIALLFKQEDHPRWVLFLAGSRIYLFDAHTYAQGRYLYINFDDAYASKNVKTFQAVSALLAKECLAPDTESDEVLHEKLREGSIKSTHGVSEQLQLAVREAIELIANGWIEARRATKQGYQQLNEREPALPDGSREIKAEQLKQESLIFVYRVLFCLYAEARGGELGILPITEDVYRLGYSLEALRDLADQGEPGTQSEQGSYYAEHLNRLFQLIHQGFHPEKDHLSKEQQAQQHDKPDLSISPTQQVELFAGKQEQLPLKIGDKKELDTNNTKTFVITPLTATLFDPQSTPLLSRVKLGNLVLQQVIRRLSLGTGKKGKQIGRINYAELGIVQLGSVYEGLLSYKGFFAREDLIQVLQKEKKGKKKDQPVIYDNAIDPKKPTWFVSKDRMEDFTTGEIVIEHRTKAPRIYKTGTFILHLNGVDRVNSASYYTPEVLTRTLVKETLKERLKDIGKEQADEILQLKICEPAMGSAAFLVEAIDQLARHYLILKQEQIRKNIDPSNFEDELGRVKHYIAVRNVYGVDLNPTAVELGALSLWLASIHRLKIKTGTQGGSDIYQSGQTPWFGLRLRAGNSLIGARRAVWTRDQLTTGKHYGKKALAPRQLKPGEQRKDNEIYHFLVWDEDMAPAARDKLMKSYWKEACEEINDWQKKQVKQNWTPELLSRAKTLCKSIDTHWEEYAEERIQGLTKAQCTASVWPVNSNDWQARKPGPGLQQQEQVKTHLEVQSGAFQRLKLLMDSWCSFYFWPLNKSGQLPTREAWLAAAEFLLGCGADSKESRAFLMIALGNELDIEALFAESQQELPDTRVLAESVPWFEVAKEVDQQQHFHHWELIFTEILGPEFKGQAIKPTGFDLMFGNPPWSKVTRSDVILLSEYEPLLGVRNSKSAVYNQKREQIIENGRLDHYRCTFEYGAGSAMFLNDRTIYPALAGVQTNLYKNFIERSWSLLNKSGLVSLIHEEGIYTDSSGGNFREQCYHRLKYHYQFVNKLDLFNDVKSNKVFSINIYAAELGEIDFISISNLYSVKTIDQCNSVTKNTLIPGLRNGEGKPEVKGHPYRKIIINDDVLNVVSSIYEPKANYTQSKLPSIHSNFALQIIKKIGKSAKKLSDLRKNLEPTVMFDEAYAQRDGYITLKRNPVVEPKVLGDLVMVMSHIANNSALGKQPLSGNSKQITYREIDLLTLPEDFLQSSIYRLNNKTTIEKNNLNAKTPTWLVKKKKRKVTDHYRLAWRRRSQPDDTRTLISTIIPPRIYHINNIVSVDMVDTKIMVLFAGCCQSLVYDFLVKGFNKPDVWFEAIEKLPVLGGSVVPLINNRMLRLTCLTKHYHDLWNQVADVNISDESWTSSNSMLKNKYEKSWEELTSCNWESDYPLRTSYARRQAVLEIDVLVALGLGVSLNELTTIYHHYFYTFKKYDEADVFDKQGLLIPNYERQSMGRAEARKALLSWDKESPLELSWKIDDGETELRRTFHPPFSHVDRIEDYKTAYRVFSERLGLNKEK